MTAEPTLAPLAAPGPSKAATDNGKGHPETLTLRVTEYLAVCIEGGSLAAEAMLAAGRIQTLAATGRPEQVVHEAGQLGLSATEYRERFRALAGAVES